MVDSDVSRQLRCVARRAGVELAAAAQHDRNGTTRRSSALAARRAAIALAVAAGVLAGCATTTYKVFETRGDAIFEGKGGARSVHEGMEVWEWGDPPWRYQVLGIIDDERPGDAGPMGRLWGDVVRKAREVGGQALIQVRSQSQVVGQQTVGNAPATAFGSSAPGATAVPLRRHRSQFIVIRHVP